MVRIPCEIWKLSLSHLDKPRSRENSGKKQGLVIVPKVCPVPHSRATSSKLPLPLEGFTASGDSTNLAQP